MLMLKTSLLKRMKLDSKSSTFHSIQRESELLLQSDTQAQKEGLESLLKEHQKSSLNSVIPNCVPMVNNVNLLQKLRMKLLVRELSRNSQRNATEHSLLLILILKGMNGRESRNRITTLKAKLTENALNKD